MERRWLNSSCERKKNQTVKNKIKENSHFQLRIQNIKQSKSKRSSMGSHWKKMANLLIERQKRFVYPPFQKWQRSYCIKSWQNVFQSLENWREYQEVATTKKLHQNQTKPKASQNQTKQNKSHLKKTLHFKSEELDTYNPKI